MTPDTLARWVDRLDVMSRCACVEFSAADAAELHTLLSESLALFVLCAEVRLAKETEAERAGMLMVEAARR